MRRNKNIASFLFSVFSAGMLSQALMGSASGTDILETEKLVKEAKLQQNSSSTDDEISNNGNREEEVQDIGANDNDDANSAGMVYIDRNKVNGALANKQLIKVASFLLPTLGVGALGGSAYHFLKKEDKNKEPSEVNTEIKDEDEPNEEDTKGEKEDKNKEPSEVNTEVKDEDEPNEEDAKGEKEDNKVTGDQNEVNNEVKDKDEPKKEDTKIKKEDNKVTGNLNTSTSVWWYVIAIVVVLIIIFYYRKNNESSSFSSSWKTNENENDNGVQYLEVPPEEKDNSSGKFFEEEKKGDGEDKSKKVGEEKNESGEFKSEEEINGKEKLQNTNNVIINEINENVEEGNTSKKKVEEEGKKKRTRVSDKAKGALLEKVKRRRETKGKRKKGLVGKQRELRLKKVKTKRKTQATTNTIGNEKNDESSSFISFGEISVEEEKNNGSSPIIVNKKNGNEETVFSFPSEDENENKIKRRNTFNNLDIKKNYRLIVDEETNKNENNNDIIKKPEEGKDNIIINSDEFFEEGKNEDGEEEKEKNEKENKIKINNEEEEEEENEDEIKNNEVQGRNNTNTNVINNETSEENNNVNREKNEDIIKIFKEGKNEDGGEEEEEGEEEEKKEGEEKEKKRITIRKTKIIKIKINRETQVTTNTIEKQNENNNEVLSVEYNEGKNKNKGQSYNNTTVINEKIDEGKIFEEEKKEDESNNKGKNNIGNEIFDSGESYGKTLCDKFDKFKEVLKEDPVCVKITKGKKTIVVGDLHFNTGAALFVKDYYEKKLENGDDYNLVFLGDFIDRGKQAKYGTIPKEDGKAEDKKATAKWRLKTLEIIMDLKIKYPDKVIVLSGNHEAGGDPEFVGDIQSGLFTECLNAFGGDSVKVLNNATEAFGELPKCAVLEQKDKDGNDLNTFLVHGTVPYDPNEKMDLKGIVGKMSNIENKKSYSIEDKENGELVKGMLWNDYKGAKKRGKGVYNLKDPDDVNLFKNANNIQRVISAHDHHEPYVYHGDVNYIKVITSPNMNMDGKDGFILDIDEYGNITQVKVEEISYEEFKPQGANNANNINNENFNNNFNFNDILKNN